MNAITLYAVFTSELIPTDGGSADSTIMNFFEKIGTLANESYQQAAVLSGMLFTLVIWIFSALSLLLAALFYVFFLWHYIPKQDGGLSGYCERKINKRLMKVVSVKVNKAIAKEEQQRIRAELLTAKKTGEKPPAGRQATLPTIPNLESKKENALLGMPTLSRNDTMATLPMYTSRPGTPGGIEMNTLDQKRPLPQRSGTSNTLASQTSYSSNAPLMASAAGMGYDHFASPEPTLPQIDMNNYPPVRPGTAQSNMSFETGLSVHRTQTGNSSNFGPTYSQTPSPFQSGQQPAMLPPVRSNTSNSMNNYGGPGAGPRPGPGGPMYDGGMGGRASPAPSNFTNRPGPGPRVGQPGRQIYDDGMSGRASPAPSNFNARSGPPGRPMYDDGMSGRGSPAPSNFNTRSGPPGRPVYDDGMSGRASPAPSSFSNRGPPANRSDFNGPPIGTFRSATGPIPQPNRPQFPPQRNMTAPMPPRPDNYINRPGTAASQRTMPLPQSGPGPGSSYGYNDDEESQRGPQRW